MAYTTKLVDPGIILSGQSAAWQIVGYFPRPDHTDQVPDDFPILAHRHGAGDKALLDYQGNRG